jgi:hypothetical protein
VVIAASSTNGSRAATLSPITDLISLSYSTLALLAVGTIPVEVFARGRCGEEDSRRQGTQSPSDRRSNSALASDVWTAVAVTSDSVRSGVERLLGS